MQYETKIVVFNPTTDETKFAADVYTRRVYANEETSWERIRCGIGGFTKHDAYRDAFEALAFAYSTPLTKESTNKESTND